MKSVGQATSRGDELAEASPAKPGRLGGLPGRFGIGESRQQLQTATATIGVEPRR
jgi:hypothetical protein